MAPSQFPPVFNPTPQDIENLLSAQCHLGSKNLQVHMEPYLWKLRPDGVHILNIGKTWYVGSHMGMAMSIRKRERQKEEREILMICALQGEDCPGCSYHRRH